VDGGGCVGWQDRVCEPSTTQTSTTVTSTTATSTTTTLHAEVLRALNISAADLLEANMTVAELRSKGFTASDVLDAGASCTEVEREYGKQPAKCGNSTVLIVAIVVVVVLIMGAAIGVLVWVQHQKGSSQPIDKGRRATRSKQHQQQQQHDVVTTNPMYLKDKSLDEDSSNAEYDFATNALTPQSSGSVVYGVGDATDIGVDAVDANATACRADMYTTISRSKAAPTFEPAATDAQSSGSVVYGVGDVTDIGVDAVDANTSACRAGMYTIIPRSNAAPYKPAAAGTPTVVALRQRLRSAAHSSSLASDYGLVPLAASPVALLSGDSGALFAVPFNDGDSDGDNANFPGFAPALDRGASKTTAASVAPSLSGSAACANGTVQPPSPVDSGSKPMSASSYGMLEYAGKRAAPKAVGSAYDTLSSDERTGVATVRSTVWRDDRNEVYSELLAVPMTDEIDL
jgi:hypothetical protein